MRYLRKYESHEDIHAICREYDISDYTINDDGSIDTNNFINLSEKRLREIPLKFRNVGGSFSCCYNLLTSLLHCPETLDSYFECHHNYLTSLEGCPKSINAYFSCYNNYLTSLEGCPKWVSGSFNCRHNSIETFEGLDFAHIAHFYCDHNPIWYVWILFQDQTKFEFFNDCDIIRENRVIILDRLNFFLDYIGKETVTEVEGYKCNLESNI